MKSGTRIIVGLGVLVLIVGWFAIDANAVNICESTTAVCGGLTCIGPFTSLPITSGILECHGSGWRPDGSACGTKRCYLIFQCACGNRHSRGTFCDGYSQPGCEGCDWLTGQEAFEVESVSELAVPGSGRDERVTP